MVAGAITAPVAAIVNSFGPFLSFQVPPECGLGLTDSFGKRLKVTDLVEGKIEGTSPLGDESERGQVTLAQHSPMRPLIRLLGRGVFWGF
jgi:hypothetical protein